MAEELTAEQLYFLENGVYVPILIDERILVYLNLGYRVALKTSYNYSIPCCIHLSECANHHDLLPCLVYLSSELKKLKDEWPWFWIFFSFTVSKEQVVEWIEQNS